MTDDLASVLSLIANYSNFYSVLSVLVCFVLMVIFILRLNGEILLSSSATHHRVVQEQSMLGLQNPFSVHLLKGKISSLQGGVHLDVSVLDTTLVTAIWGVDISAFQQELQLTSIEIWERFQSRSMFEGKYIKYHECRHIYAGSKNTEIYIECPLSITEATLGEPPRKVYPLVVVTVRQNPDISFDYTAIVVQFTVLHLKDSICSLDSHIVYQFLKTNHNRILSLQPIFISTTDIGDTSEGSRNDQTPKSLQDKLDTGKCTNKSVTNAKQSSDNNGNNELESSAEVERTSQQEGTEHRKDSGLVTDDMKTSVTGADDCSSADELKETVEHSDVLKVEHSNVLKDESNNLCVVCQNAPIFYTLLLCRHACVCFSCIKLLDRCPMCRGYIDSYFRLDGAPDPIVPEDNMEDGVHPRIHWWEALNNRLNRLLGFE